MRIFILAAFGLALAAPAFAAERDARCVFTSGGPDRPWRGPCHFTSERGGSFTLTPVEGGDLEGMEEFDLEIIRPGVGHARYMMNSGRHEDAGVLYRSRRDPACWESRGGFSVCVY
jgi:hypothetical protein